MAKRAIFRNNHRQNGVKVKTLSGHHGAVLDDGIKRFQKREGLKVDGLLNPSGPTITRLKDQLAPLMNPYKPPSPDEVDAHQSRIHGTSETPGGQGLLTHVSRRPKLHPNSTLLPVAEPDRRANDLALKTMLNYTTDGDQPRWLAGDIAQRGQPAIAKVRALVQDADKAEPGRGEGLLRGILDHLAEPLHASFLGGPAPKKVPLGVRLAEAGPQESGEDARTAVSDGGSGGVEKPQEQSAPEDIDVKWVPGAPNSVPDYDPETGATRTIDGRTGRPVPGPVMVDKKTGEPILAPDGKPYHTGNQRMRELLNMSKDLAAKALGKMTPEQMDQWRRDMAYMSAFFGASRPVWGKVKGEAELRPYASIPSSKTPRSQKTAPPNASV